MQGFTWPNGQSQQFGQLQSTPSHLSHNTSRNNGSNAASYFLPLSNNGMGGVFGLITMQSVGTNQERQRQNTLTASGNQGYYPNSTQNATFATTQAVNVNTAFGQKLMYAQKTSVSGNSQLSSVLLNNVEYYEAHKSRTQNVTAHMKNSTSASTTQAVYNTQPPLQSCMYSQSFQQTAGGPQSLPSYSQAIFAKNLYTTSSHVPSAKKCHTVSPAMQFSNFSVNNSGNNQSDKANYIVPQTNAVQAVNGCTPFLPNNATSLGYSLTAIPGHTHYTSYQNQEQMQQHVRGKRNLQPPPQIINSANIPTNDHPANPSGNLTSTSYQKTNCTPCVNQNVQVTSGANLTSPSRALRAVAVVLPLSQESTSDDQPSPTSKPSPNASSPSGDQAKDVQLHIPDAACLNEKSKQLTSSCNISTENANVQNHSPFLNQIIMDHPAPRVSHLPLTFAKLVKGDIPQTKQTSERRKKKSGNLKTPTETKQCVEPLSSVSATEWTLRQLYGKILDLENESEKSINKIEPDDELKTIKEILSRFWNGDIKHLLRTIRTGDVYHKTKFEVRKLFATINLDSVILSQIKDPNIQDTKYHVIQHDEVYEEKIPYVSSWLNINSQLDDIDKEFGLPFFLSQEYCDHKDADTQEGLKDNSQTELKSEPLTQTDTVNQDVKSKERKSNHVEEIQNKSIHSETDSPKDIDTSQCESEVALSDSSYSFKIEVLPPEKAKVIFEQMDCTSSQMVSPPEATAPNDQNEDKPQTCNATTIETVCCIEKWKERVFGLVSDGKCKCQVLHEDKETKSHNTDDNSWSVDFFDLTEDDDMPIVPLQVTGDIQDGRSLNNSIIVLSEDESQVTEDSQTSHSNNDENHFAKSTEGPHVASSDKNAFETLKHLFHVSESPYLNEHEMKKCEGDCRMGLVAEETQDSQEAESNITFQPVSPSDGVNEQCNKPDEDVPSLSLSHPSKKLSSHRKSQTILDSFAKCKNTAPVAGVELSLFGSRREKCPSMSTRRSHVHLFDKALQPPEKIYVQMNSLTTSGNEALSNTSLKRRIHENWMKSFTLGTIKIRKKNKKFAIVGNNASLNPSKLKLKGSSSKRKVKDSDDCLYHKKRRTHTVEHSVTLVEKKDIGLKPHQKDILKFNVLPSTFSFEDESKNGNLTDSTADEKTVPEKAEEKELILKPQGTWSDKFREKSPSPSPTSSPETLGLFKEFQKRHKMRQMSVDEVRSLF